MITPGSPEACADGCCCPQIDNRHGAGVTIEHRTKCPAYVERKYIVSGACPVHGDPELFEALPGP
jgi:hypothetical protein